LWKFIVSTAGPNDLAGFIPQPVKPICRSKYTGQLWVLYLSLFILGQTSSLFVFQKKYK